MLLSSNLCEFSVVFKVLSLSFVTRILSVEDSSSVCRKLIVFFKTFYQRTLILISYHESWQRVFNIFKNNFIYTSKAVSLSEVFFICRALSYEIILLLLDFLC